MCSCGGGRICVEMALKPLAEQMGCPWIPAGIASFASPKMLRQRPEGPSPPLSEGLSGCALSGCSDGGCSQRHIHPQRGVFSHFPQSRWVGHLEVARESPFSCTSVSGPSESPLDSSEVQFLPISTARGPDQAASLISCGEGCDSLSLVSLPHSAPLSPFFIQHPSFKSTDLTVLLTGMSPSCALFSE